MYSVVGALIAVFALLTMKLPNEEQVIKSVSKKNVHRIMITSPQGSGSCSSVFLTYKNKIRHITNAHCCTGELNYDGSLATIVKKEPQVDLCEITHNKMPKSGVNLASSNLETGDKVYIVGYPSTYDLSISEGHVTVAFRISAFFTPVTQTNAWAYFGNSGGAALSSEGRLVGITSLIYVEHKHAAFIPLNVLKEFLNK